MRQVTTAEVCVGAGKTARFSVPLPPTASFDRLLPMPRRIAVAQAGQKRDPGLEIAGIRRMPVYIRDAAGARPRDKSPVGRQHPGASRSCAGGSA